MATVEQRRVDPEYWTLVEAHPGRWECAECGTVVKTDHADECASSDR